MQPEQVNPSGNKTQNTDKIEGKENHLDVNRFFSKNQSNSKNHLVSSNHTLFSIKRKRSSWKSVHYITDEKKSDKNQVLVCLLVSYLGLQNYYHSISRTI